MSRTACLAAVLLASTAFAEAPKLVITEIQYDPTSAEREEQQTEWVEIYNAGGEDVSLKGLQITSGMHTKPDSVKQRYALTDGVVKPGEYIVIGVGTAESYAGIGLPAIGAFCGVVKMPWLANGGDSVAIRDEKGQVIDQVIYQVAAPWPEKSMGCSIQFIPPTSAADLAEANDDPKNWVISNGANAQTFLGHGMGSPGSGPGSAPTTQPFTSNVKSETR